MNPKILITNDDGISSLGINALSLAMSKIADVTIVAPLIQQSARSHALTLESVITLELISLKNGFKGWAVHGTPVDCVKIALNSVLNDPPDLIISGINHGANVGSNLIYSGTVASAYEGAMLGIPSIAISLASSRIHNFECSKFVARHIVEYVLENKPPKGSMLNVNVPDLDIKSLKGFKITRQGNQFFKDDFEKRKNPRKENYFWLKGEIIDKDTSNDFDGRAVSEGYVSITPLHYNLTAMSYYNDLKLDWNDG
tara:strand:- start:741 stop:1505 length:765 start_codon:yes stop_codon:yes gene_type:complete